MTEVLCGEVSHVGDLRIGCDYKAGHLGPHSWGYQQKPIPVINKPSTHVQDRINFLQRHSETIKAHMATRMEDADWHGVSDDANDLREVDAELRGLRYAIRAQ